MILAPTLTVLNGRRRSAAFDPDAAAFFAAAGITDPDQKAAYNAHVLRGRADGWYDKQLVAYPFIGGTFTAHKIDAIAPDGIALVKVNTVTDSANGVQGDGVSGRLETGYQRDDFPQTLFGIAAYIHTVPSVDPSSLGGSDDFATSTQLSELFISGGNWRFRNNSTASVSSSSGLLGAVVGSRSATHDQIICQGPSYTSEANAAPTANLAQDLSIFALNRNGAFILFSDALISYYAITRGLSEAEAVSFRDSINQLQTDLGRATH